MQINTIMKENSWALQPSLADGHCLLHSTVSFHNSQLPDSPVILLKSLIDMIVSHVNSHLIEYTIFGLSKPKILSQMRDYIYSKKYNSDFGDLVPLIITQALKVNLLVLDTGCSGNVNWDLFEATPPSTMHIPVHRRGEHYNGLTMQAYPAPVSPCLHHPFHPHQHPPPNTESPCPTKVAPPTSPPKP